MDKKQRNSSLELLRIISMFTIIALHYYYHGFGRTATTIENYGPNHAYLHLLATLGRSSCSVFLLISSYFLIESKTTFFKNRIISIAGQMSFYGILVWCIVNAFGQKLGLWELFQSIFAFMTTYNWFFETYFVLLFFVPYLNKMLHSLSKGQHRRLLLIIFVLYFAINSIRRVYFFSYLFYAVNVYCIGAYIRLYPEDFQYDNRINLILAVVFALAIAGSILLIDVTALQFSSNSLMLKYEHFTELWTLPSILYAIFIFLYFSKLKFENNIINRVASTCGGIYLLHDNALIYDTLWNKILPNAPHLDSPYLHSLLKINLIFIVGMLVELLRQKTLGRLHDQYATRCVDRLFVLIDKKFPKVCAFFDEK